MSLKDIEGKLSGFNALSHITKRRYINGGSLCLVRSVGPVQVFNSSINLITLSSARQGIYQNSMSRELVVCAAMRKRIYLGPLVSFTFKLNHLKWAQNHTCRKKNPYTNKRTILYIYTLFDTRFIFSNFIYVSLERNYRWI